MLRAVKLKNVIKKNIKLLRTLLNILSPLKALCDEKKDIFKVIIQYSPKS